MPTLLQNGVFGALMLLVAPWGVAQNRAELTPQQSAFVEVEKAINNAPTNRAASVLAGADGLASYSLYPYLEMAYLRRVMHIRQRNRIEQFLFKYDGQPVADVLRKSWLRYLAKYNHQSAFLASYKPGNGTKITCYYLNYQLANSQRVSSWSNQIAPLWLSAQSQPKECDPVFKQWKDAGLLSPELVLGRIALVAKGGNTKLMSYLRRRLPKEQQYLADLWRQTRRSASYVSRTANFPLRFPEEERKVLTYGLKRLAWQQPKKAIQGYSKWASKANFTASQQQDILRAIALSLTLDKDPLAQEWLQRADVNGAQDDVKRWHLAHLLEQQDWGNALSLINEAPAVRQNADNFRYWKARSLDELNAAQAGNTLYEPLAKERSYYGFLASARLAKTPTLRHMPAPSDDTVRAQLANQPGALRARELYQLGRWVEARREWRKLVANLSKDELREAAMLASEWGWYDQAIIGFAKSGYLDDVDRRFPLAFAPEFSRQGDVHGVDTAFAMAIARRESSFMVDAVSPAGAKGLMQLMPGTARYINQARVKNSTLFTPEQNVEFGVKYLKYLSEKMGDNPVLVSASYNAGWQKVINWLPETEPLPTDIWIENIPYRETRSYVKAVLAYRYIYEQQLGSPSNLFSDLAQRSIKPANTLGTPALGSGQLAPD